MRKAILLCVVQVTAQMAMSWLISIASMSDQHLPSGHGESAAMHAHEAIEVILGSEKAVTDLLTREHVLTISRAHQDGQLQLAGDGVHAQGASGLRCDFLLLNMKACCTHSKEKEENACHQDAAQGACPTCMHAVGVGLANSLSMGVSSECFLCSCLGALVHAISRTRAGRHVISCQDLQKDCSPL